MSFIHSSLLHYLQLPREIHGIRNVVGDAEVAYGWLEVAIESEASWRFNFRTDNDGCQADHVVVAIGSMKGNCRHEKHMADSVHERRRHLLKQDNWNLFKSDVTGNFKKDLDSGNLSQNRGYIIHDSKGGADERKLKYLAVKGFIRAFDTFQQVFAHDLPLPKVLGEDLDHVVLFRRFVENEKL